MDTHSILLSIINRIDWKSLYPENKTYDLMSETEIPHFKQRGGIWPFSSKRIKYENNNYEKNSIIKILTDLFPNVLAILISEYLNTYCDLIFDATIPYFKQRGGSSPFWSKMIKYDNTFYMHTNSSSSHNNTLIHNDKLVRISRIPYIQPNYYNCHKIEDAKYNIEKSCKYIIINNTIYVVNIDHFYKNIYVWKSGIWTIFPLNYKHITDICLTEHEIYISQRDSVIVCDYNGNVIRKWSVMENSYGKIGLIFTESAVNKFYYDNNVKKASITYGCNAAEGIISVEVYNDTVFVTIDDIPQLLMYSKYGELLDIFQYKFSMNPLTTSVIDNKLFVTFNTEVLVYTLKIKN